MEDDGEGERVLQNHSGEEEALLSWGGGGEEITACREPPRVIPFKQPILRGRRGHEGDMRAAQEADPGLERFCTSHIGSAALAAQSASLRCLQVSIFKNPGLAAPALTALG